MPMPPDVTAWSDCIPGRECRPPCAADARPIGVLEGEGVGPEVVAAALRVLRAVEADGPHRFAVRRGGPIGVRAEQCRGAALAPEVEGFCRGVFADGGALLHGAAGGRFVYDLRRRFDLFCKICPVRPWPELRGGSRIKTDFLDGVDFIIVRENLGGVYQGQWGESVRADGARVAEQHFSYAEPDVRRILAAAAAIARRRRSRLAVIYKEAGIPTISGLWRECALEIAETAGIEARMLNVDCAAYRLIQDARDFDVVVAPNLCGDVLADLSAVLLGSRALAYAGNFASGGPAVYQTNHGAALDLGGTDQANPVGQILALAMLLRESFGLADAAVLIERAVREVWRQGWRTADLAEPGCRRVGTREMGARVAEAVTEISKGCARL
jgi:3-isopropylmalate dehydrogenase